MTSIAALVARAIVLAATVLVTGAVVFRIAIVGRAGRLSHGLDVTWNDLAARGGFLGSAAIVLLAPLRLYLQASAFVMRGDPVAPMMHNVLATGWGRGWDLQTITAAIACVAFWMARRRRWPWALCALAALALALAPARMGHAAAAEHRLALSIASDWAHVTSAGAWVGTLSLLAVVLGRRSTQIAPATSAACIRCFHPVALTSAGVLLSTGVITLFLRVDRVADLLHSEYGLILAAKLGATLGVAMLGLHHARHGERLANEAGPLAVGRTLIAESWFAAAVIAATALLVGTAPPMSSM
jgi:putative copper export protein